jgi:hypothetical protein
MVERLPLHLQQQQLQQQVVELSNPPPSATAATTAADGCVVSLDLQPQQHPTALSHRFSQN